MHPIGGFLGPFPFRALLLRTRSLKGRCNIRVYVPVCSCSCVCVCVCVCVCPPLPLLPRPYCGTEQQNPHPHPHMTPRPRPRIRARRKQLQRPTPGKNYPLKSARFIWGPFPWKKPEEKIHGKIQIRIWEFHSQHPHCKNYALEALL